VPRLLGSVDWHDLFLLAVLIGAAFAARLLVLFVLMPLLELLNLAEPISSAYKVALTWGGLRGALTLAPALAATEHPLLPHDVQRFIALLATGFVLLRFCQRHDLAHRYRPPGPRPTVTRNQILRDRVLAVLCRGDRRRPRHGATPALSEEQSGVIELPGMDHRGGCSRSRRAARRAGSAGVALVALANRSACLPWKRTLIAWRRRAQFRSCCRMPFSCRRCP
jgi:hypothetical protein